MKVNDMHVWKSILVACFLVISSVASLFMIVFYCKRYCRSMIFLFCTLLVCSLVPLTVAFGILDYLNPYDQTVELKLVGIVEPDIPFTHEGVWEVVYERPNQWYDTQLSHDKLSEWVDTDLTEHSYLISYGKEVTSLHYNVWDTFDAVYYYGEKVGYVTLCKDFIPTKIFIYELPKIRIGNPCH